MAALRQMEDRAGPIYETACDRSRTVSAAWRAAGSPPKVQRIHTADGPRWFLWRRVGAPAPRVPATDAQVTAWFAWWRERDRLRRELRGPR